MPGATVTASMLIRRTPADVFDAFVDPGTLCRFWLDAASGPLVPGAVVEWTFKVPGVRDTVSVIRFERPDALALRFSDGEEVVLEFQDIGGGTRVAATSSGFPDQDLLSRATTTVEGFTLVLADFKALLETGRPADLVRDKAELITRQMGQNPGQPGR